MAVALAAASGACPSALATSTLRTASQATDAQLGRSQGRGKLLHLGGSFAFGAGEAVDAFGEAPKLPKDPKHAQSAARDDARRQVSLDLIEVAVDPRQKLDVVLRGRHEIR